MADTIRLWGKMMFLVSGSLSAEDFMVKCMYQRLISMIFYSREITRDSIDICVYRIYTPRTWD